MPGDETDDFRELIADMPESVGIYELDGAIRYLNPMTERMFGMSLAEVRGERLFELFPGAVGNPFFQAFQRVATHGGAEAVEHYYAPFEAWFSNRIARLGQHVHVVARDVTEDVRRRRRTETLARISEVLIDDRLDFSVATARIAQILAETLGADSTLALLSKDGEWLDLAALGHADPNRATPAHGAISRWPANAGHLGRALATRSVVLVQLDSLEAAVRQGDDPRLRGVSERYAPGSLLLVPLLVGEEALGVFMAARPRGARPLTEDERLLGVSIAPSLSLYLAHTRRRAEAAFLRERLERLADALPALVAFIDRDERYQYVNAAYAHWFTTQRESFLGRTLRELTPPGAYERIQPLVQRALSGSPVRFQERFVYPSGTRDIDVQYLPVRNERGVEGLAVLVLDISAEMRVLANDREQLESERRSMRRLESLLALAGKLAAAASPEQIAHVAVDEGAAALDAAMAGMFQLSADGREILLVHERGFRPEQMAALRRMPLDASGPLGDAVRSGVPVWIASREECARRYPALEALHRPNPAPLAFAAAPYGIEGKMAGCLCFAFNDDRRLTSTDRTYIEILTSHSAEALRRAHIWTDLQRARTDAEAASRAKDEFLAMLGHELRNPLAPISTALHLMAMREPDRLTREREIVARQVDHLSRLVDDLLDISRITRGQVELRPEHLKLAAVVSKAIEMTQPLLENRHHRLEVDVAEQLAVFADSTRLRQVVANLLSNAAKYTPPRGLIQVRAESREAEVVLSVRDNGVGIAPEILPRIFGIFVQAPQPSARSEGGLGIGLAIVRSLIAAHGGTVEAHSDGPGHGSEFRVRLPAPAAVTAVRDEPATAPALSGRRRKILVVDDNEDAASLLTEFIELHGHEVVAAYDGPSALQIAEQFQPDVAVLDLGLPVMDGYELAQRLRSSRPLRLIAVTGYGRQADRELALRAGFEAHLPKPVALQTLLRLLDEAS